MSEQLSCGGDSEVQVEKDEMPVSSQSGQMVPVSEAIKYRKRAQSAEQQLEQMTAEIQQSRQTQQDLERRIQQAQLESELTCQLVKAGAVDVELALLLAHKKLDTVGEDKPELASLIGTLRKERPYLFYNAGNEAAGAGPTAGVRSPGGGRRGSLSRSAQQAQRSGSRKDMQEYLRLRRSGR
jgi:hypothetical protein